MAHVLPHPPIPNITVQWMLVGWAVAHVLLSLCCIARSCSKANDAAEERVLLRESARLRVNVTRPKHGMPCKSGYDYCGHFTCWGLTMFVCVLAYSCLGPDPQGNCNSIPYAVIFGLLYLLYLSIQSNLLSGLALSGRKLSYREVLQQLSETPPQVLFQIKYEKTVTRSWDEVTVKVDKWGSRSETRERKSSTSTSTSTKRKVVSLTAAEGWQHTDSLAGVWEALPDLSAVSRFVEVRWKNEVVYGNAAAQEAVLAMYRSLQAATNNGGANLSAMEFVSPDSQLLPTQAGAMTMFEATLCLLGVLLVFPWPYQIYAASSTIVITLPNRRVLTYNPAGASK